MSLVNAATPTNNTNSQPAGSGSAPAAGTQTPPNTGAPNNQTGGDTPPAQGASPSGDNSTPVTPDKWYYDETMEGVGNKPDWLLPKFKNAAEQAKSFAELEKKFGAFKGAPEEYSLEIPDMPEAIFQKEDPLLKDFLEDARKNNVSQDYVTSLLKHYVNLQASTRPDTQKELQKLGPNGAHDIQILAQWGNNNLTGEEFTLFKNMMTTAESVRLLEKLRGMATGPSTSPKNPNTPQETESQVRAMIHDPRFQTDENFRNQVREKLKQFGE